VTLVSGASRDEPTLLRIGELAAATDVNRRLLRYYEAQGLITATRTSGGQRTYDRDAVGAVGHVRELLAVGLPTRVIRELLGCIRETGRLEHCAVPTLVEHLRAFDEQIASLAGTRDALAGLIDSSADTSADTSGDTSADTSVDTSADTSADT
jgi:DNA-binding transcriptional MerR regulator